MRNLILVLILALLVNNSFAQPKKETVSKDEQELKESEVVDFKAIRDVLKNDMLGAEVERKKIKVEKLETEKKMRMVNKYNVPHAGEFWTFFSEYWLVKNAMILKWDFQKPDYGIEESFQFFLEKLGIYEIRYKILLVNTPDVTHFALPSNHGEFIFILSVPFMRTLDLTKLEISVLLFEDYLRAKAGFFREYASVKGINEFLGSNFYQKKLDVKLLENISKKYDEMIFDKGFNFQQQFEITKQMVTIFKSEMKLWNTYFKMLKKIDNLIKSNILYQKYVKIYPSPELQLSWLKPEEKKF